MDRPARLPYPNGWFTVAFGDELPTNKVLTRRFMGEEIVLYRTSSGLIRAVRPFCPHLGAHLGYGGRVDGEDLVCPFHNFAFSPSGDCVRTAYSTPPPRARLTTLEVREVDGIILVWHHTQGHPSDWEVFSMNVHGVSPDGHIVYTLVDHPQDVMENGVDIGHLPSVHHASLSEFRLQQKGASLEISFDLTALSGHHIGIFSAIHARVSIQIYGLGWLLAKVYIPALRSRIQFWLLPTPVDPVHIELRLAGNLEEIGRTRLWGPVSRLIGKAATKLGGYDISRDFPIWQNKTYIEHPKLAKGDGPIMEFRRWASQFYTE